jgi:hypothetical protein
VGVAVATTLIGEVTLALSVGFDIVKGKSFEPAGGGVASGAGSCLLFPGVHVIATGGVDGYEVGVGLGLGAGLGLGLGLGAGAGVGVVVVLMLLEVPLHPTINKETVKIDSPQRMRRRRRAGEMTYIYYLQIRITDAGKPEIGSGERLGPRRYRASANKTYYKKLWKNSKNAAIPELPYAQVKVRDQVAHSSSAPLSNTLHAECTRALLNPNEIPPAGT